MEALNSAETTLQWFWMIEYLTNLQQVDPRVLNDLVDDAPPFPADLRSKIDELIALRALEEICKDGDELGDSGNKVGIDLSETCVNVLNCLMKEASVSDIMTRMKPLQFDIRPFILHKRATMPKSALHQMFSEKQFDYNQGPIKETTSRAFILQMPEKPLHSPNFASLNNDLEGGSTSKVSFPIDAENFAHEDQSGRGEADFLLPNAKKFKQTVPNTSETELRVPNPSERENSAAVPDGGAGFFEGDELGNEASHTVANGNSNSDSLKSVSRVLGGDLIISSVLPLKKRFIDYSGNLAENLQECQQNREDPDLPPNTKKLRRSDVLAPEVKSAVVNVNGRTDAEIVGDETIKENSVNCVKPREISDIGSKHKDFVQESTATVVSADGFVENARNHISADGLQHKEDIVEHNTEFDLDVNMEQVTYKDPTSSREDIDVTLKQKESSSSKEQKACVKCNQGSQLLVCQMEDCALVAHAKCLGLSDGLCLFGNFYCPSCAYADAEKEYLEAEMEASISRVNLDTFLCYGFGVDIANIWEENRNLAGNDQSELDDSKKGGNQEMCEEKAVEDEVTNPEGMNLGQDHGNGGSSDEDHEEHVKKHSDADGGVCISAKKGGNQERCEEKVVEDEVTNPEGMNLCQDHGNGGSSHEDHEEHVKKHSDADGGVCVSEKRVLLIEDSNGGKNDDKVVLETDEAKTIEEALDDLHADGCKTPEQEHQNQLSDESPRSPTEEDEAKKQKETKVLTPWKKLFNFGTSIFMAGLGGSEHGKK